MLDALDVRALKRAYPLSQVASGYGIDLRPVGRSLVGRCPFHDDGGRPNFNLYPAFDAADESFYCYRCQAGGDVITFVRLTQGLNFTEARGWLEGHPAAGYSATHPRPSIRHQARAPSARSPDELTCLAAAVELYHRHLLRDANALAYLEQRGVTLKSIESCRLGYARGTELASYLRQRRLSLDAAQQVGLLQHGNRELLAGRLVIPELRKGRAIWLIGRTVSESALPRYLALPGRKPIFGWETAAQSRWVIVTEGVFDALTLRGWGLPSIALLGTHADNRTLQVLSRFERVCLALDNDQAGQTATADLLEAIGRRARAVELPDVNDVAELAPKRDGRSLFMTALKRQAAALAA